jgi:hypothetical protein
MAEYKLSDFYDEETVEEIKDQSGLGDAVLLPAENLSDLMKAEFLCEIFNKFTLAQLQEKLK